MVNILVIIITTVIFHCKVKNVIKELKKNIIKIIIITIIVLFYSTTVKLLY